MCWFLALLHALARTTRSFYAFLFIRAGGAGVLHTPRHIIPYFADLTWACTSRLADFDSPIDSAIDAFFACRAFRLRTRSGTDGILLAGYINAVLIFGAGVSLGTDHLAAIDRPPVVADARPRGT